MPSPGNAVTLTEAAHILGVARFAVQQMVLRGELGSAGAGRHRQLDREVVERQAAQRWRYRVGDNLPADSYWLPAAG